MSMPSDQLGDMSDLLSAIQSDIQRDSKNDDDADVSVVREAEQAPQFEMLESAFEPAVRSDAQAEVEPEAQTDLLSAAIKAAEHEQAQMSMEALAETSLELDTSVDSSVDSSGDSSGEILTETAETYVEAPVETSENAFAELATAETAGFESIVAETTAHDIPADQETADFQSSSADWQVEEQVDPIQQLTADPIAAVPEVSGVDPALSLMVPTDAVAFAIDADSRAVIAALFGAGSEQRVLEGDVSATVDYLSQNTCPSMILVDLSSSADPMADLDSLADVCTPGTVVLTLGATNDIGLYRKLRNAGVADYVVKPLNVEVLAESIRNSMEPHLAAGAGGAVQGKLICVIGARGGVGATTIATNCASLIADEVGKKVGLIDFDLQFGTVALTLDMETSSGLGEAIDNPSRVDATFIDSVSVRAGDRLFVIASEDGIEDGSGASPENVAEFLNHLRNEFEVVVVDIPRHSAARWMRAMSGVTKLMLVTDLSLSGLRDTGRLIAAAKDVVEPSRILMVANRVGGDKYGGIDQAEFENAIERKFDFVVADDSKAAGAAARAGKPVVQVGKDGKMAGDIRDICHAVVKKPASAVVEKTKKKMKLKLPFIGGKEA